MLKSSHKKPVRIKKMFVHVSKYKKIKELNSTVKTERLQLKN